MFASTSVEEIAAQVVAGHTGERERAVALHDYVRDRVKFGFVKYFDAATPEYTLQRSCGCCSNKSRLLVALYRAAGLEAYQHAVVVPRALMEGVVPAPYIWTIGPEVVHCYAEVALDGHWCSLDSFVIDTPLLLGAQERLLQEGRTVGYGIRVDGTNLWDGAGDAFAQLEPGMVIEDHGRIEDHAAYFRDKRYRHRFLGVPFNTLFRLMGERGIAPINANIERLRRYEEASGA